MPEWIIKWLHSAPWHELFLVFLVENILILVLVVLIGHLMIAKFKSRRVALTPEPLTKIEVVVALVNVLLNTATTLAGLWLWRTGIVNFREDFGFFAFLDVLILLIIMDLLMYILHRAAHIPLFYSLLHKFHHRYDRPRPLTLFALNPVENIAFGGLWLMVISVFDASWLGMSIYLMLNVFFGAVGHLGVEPLPFNWINKPVIRNFAGGSFHVQHHQDMNHNFGFYTLFWDKLFGTIRSDYEQNYGVVPKWLKK